MRKLYKQQLEFIRRPIKRGKDVNPTDFLMLNDMIIGNVTEESKDINEIKEVLTIVKGNLEWLVSNHPEINNYFPDILENLIRCVNKGIKDNEIHEIPSCIEEELKCFRIIN